MEVIAGVVLAIVGLISLVATAVAYNTQQNGKLVRIELLREMSALELRLVQSLQSGVFERMTRIEERLVALSSTVRENNEIFQAQLTTLAKVHQGWGRAEK